jgi:hypothetical protein
VVDVAVRQLYARLGFVEYGVEKNSLKYDGKYYDEILMAKELSPDADRDAVGVPCTGAELYLDGSWVSIEFASPSAG